MQTASVGAPANGSKMVFTVGSGVIGVFVSNNELRSAGLINLTQAGSMMRCGTR